MGLSSKKQKSTSDPTAYAKPYITGAGDALTGAYGQSSGLASNVSNTIAGNLPGLASKAFTADPGVTAATDYNTSVLGGKYLDAGNPYLNAQIDATNSGVRDRVAAQFSAAGRTGSGANQSVLARALAENETNLRYGDYSNERARMGQAAALAPSLNSAQYTGLGAYLQAAQAATGLPLDTANAYASGVGGLMGRYMTQTGKINPSTMDNIGQALNIGKSIAGFF